ncbi:MAG TPA: phosphoglycerate dehydrogenase [Anaerolineales bacterium]|nr:phosphoglycerate dehydrogenase [Anaerolineales bacterium]
MSPQPSFRVLVSAPYLLPEVERFRELLRQAGVDIVEAQVVERLGEEELLLHAGDVDGVVCGDDRFSSRVLEAFAPRLKVISKWGTGIDSIDREAASRLGIAVLNTPGAFTEAVADSVMAYILAFARRLPWMDRSLKSGGWEKLPGRSLGECSLGVVGVGRIGKAVLQRARAFGMTLYGTDIIEIAPSFVGRVGVTMVGLEEVARRSDFISLSCDLNPTSFHLIDRHVIDWMKPAAVLINTARGAIVDEAALVEALRNHRIAGAALDVYEDEPLPLDSPLREMDHVLLAAHNANSSPIAWERVHRNTLRNLLRGLGLEVPGGLRDPEPGPGRGPRKVARARRRRGQ